MMSRLHFSIHCSRPYHLLCSFLKRQYRAHIVWPRLSSWWMFQSSLVSKQVKAHRHATSIVAISRFAVWAKW